MATKQQNTIELNTFHETFSEIKKKNQDFVR